MTLLQSNGKKLTVRIQMALSIEQISARVASLRYRAVDRDTRAQNVLAVRKGDIASVYPDFFPDLPFSPP